MTMSDNPSPELLQGPTLRLTARQQMEEHWFLEELELLRINQNRVFRSAVMTEAELPDLPNIEVEVFAELGDLEDAFAELDAARDGRDNITAEIAKWREELHGQAPQEL